MFLAYESNSLIFYRILNLFNIVLISPIKTSRMITNPLVILDIVPIVPNQAMGVG